MPVDDNSQANVALYVDAESPVEGGSDETGMGDTLQSFFFSPRKPTASGLVWGVGPVFGLPMGDDGLSSEKTSAGATAVLLKQVDGWTYGFLGNHLWDISGDDAMPRISIAPSCSRSLPTQRRNKPLSA